MFSFPSEVRKKAAIYIRVSTDKQEELSPDAQKRFLLDYAQKNQILVPEEFIFLEEGGISGKSAKKRPQFLKMIALAKSQEHPFDLILVWKFSRFARNQEESIVYKSMLKKDQVEVISVSEPLIEGPFGTLIERIIEWMDEYYSVRLSGEVFRGMSENARRGNFQASPPLGYSIPYHKAIPVIVEEEAAIVRLIFWKYVKEGMSAGNIALSLNQMGFRTASGKSFEKRSVEYILQNSFYKGEVCWNRYQNETKKEKRKEEWIVRKGHHPAIISEELFEKAQERYQEEYHPKQTRASASYKHWLSGLIKCSVCGRTLSYNRVERKGKNYSYFQCYGYMKKLCTKSHAISEKRVVPVVLEALQEINCYKDKFERQESEAQKFEELEENPAILIQTQLEKLKGKEKRISEAYMNGIDSLKEYKTKKQALQEERTALEKQLEQLLPENQNETKEKKNVFAVSGIVEVIESENFSNIQKNEAIRSIVERIIYDKANEKIVVYYHCL